MFRLIPREEKFFDLFEQQGSNIVAAARVLEELTLDYPEAKAKAQQIKDLEHAGDTLTHELVRRLNTTFITPIDREDIYRLAGDLDDVIDVIDGVARRTQIFRVGPAPEGVKQLTMVIERAVGALKGGVEHLKKGDGVMKACIEAKQLEEEADTIYHDALGRLFDQEQNAIELVKWKEIYDNLERCVDQAEDVANVLESITIKHA